MAKRVTIMLDDDLDKKLKLIQADNNKVELINKKSQALVCI